MNQSGYTLLLSLFILLGASSLWIAGSGAQQLSNNRYTALELERARQALISYAVNYIDHYDVQGAGIGHLPCPDTDHPDLSHSDPWVRDGPNPPCAKNAIELGWLPRHVNTTNGRYHFHNRSRQRLWYAVSEKYVNNPLNRPVSPATIGTINVATIDEVVAVLTLPSLDIEHDQSLAWWAADEVEAHRGAYSIIRTSDIRVPAMRRAADWLLQRLNAAMEKAPCKLDAELHFLHWISDKPVNPDCVAHKKQLLSEFVLFENVPYARHWFIRNQWFNYLEFALEPRCFEQNAPTCEFVVGPTKVKDTTLRFSLQVSEAVL